MSRLTRVFALILVAALPAACGDDPPTGPTPDPPTEIIEPFSGTLTPNGGITHTFVVQRAGAATVRVVALTPADAVIGLSMGPLSGQACSQTIARDDANSSTVLTGNASAGNFCVRVYDAAGSLTGPVNYELTVTHF
jgi:hypothetical protein